MSENVSFTFLLPKEQKKEFEKKTKAKDMTPSFALRQLINRFLEDDSILVHSPTDFAQKIERQISRLQETQEKELQQRMGQLDLLIQSYRNNLDHSAQVRETSLTEEITRLLEDSKVTHGITYPKTEELLLKHHPHLKTLIEQAKIRGEDPTADAINYLRDKGRVTYSNAKKRLKWVK